MDLNNQPNLTSAYQRTRSFGYKANKALELARSRLADYKDKRGHLETIMAISPGTSEEVTKARRECAEARRLVEFFGSLYGKPYVGTWQPREPRLFYCERPDSLFRNVRAIHELGRYHNGKPGHNGWYDNPFGDSARDGSGLIWGVIAQLPGRNGKARFVSGYQIGSEEGAIFDLSEIHKESGEDVETAESDAARSADHMAERAAEREREYQSAFGAGSYFADLKEEEESARDSCLAILQERKSAKARAGGNLPAICRAIRASVAGHWQTIHDNREKRERILEGDSYPYFWNPYDGTQRSAFCEGAGLSEFPE